MMEWMTRITAPLDTMTCHAVRRKKQLRSQSTPLLTVTSSPAAPFLPTAEVEGAAKEEKDKDEDEDLRPITEKKRQVERTSSMKRKEG